MDINQAIEADLGEGAQVLQQLDTVLQLLEAFRKRYPQTFQHLCEEAIGTGECSLGDGISALAWATNYLGE